MYTARNCSRRVASAVLALGRSSHYLRPPLHSLPSAYYAGQPSLRLATHLQLLSYNSDVALSTPSTSAAASSSLNLRPAQPARLLSAANEAPELAAHHHYTSNHDSISINKPSEVSEYWGIAPKHIQREDGSPWPWHCFTPADTYTADVGIDVERHYSPENSWVDRLAYWTVRALRGPVDLFFKDRHVSHALLLETVAAVPGMVGGMLLHLRSLRRFQHSGGWIKALLDEAENERMHLMTWVEVLRPAWWERALVLAVQGTFFNAYFVLYVASPRLAHRFVGYLEEEAVRSYTDFLEAIDAGNTPNGPAPLIATDYWRLPANATIRDVVLVVRADEAHHRDVNHFAADLYNDKQELRKSHAPIGYH